MSLNNSNNNKNYGAIRPVSSNNGGLPNVPSSCPARTTTRVNFDGGNNDSDSDNNSDNGSDISVDVQFLDELNCSLITQIREQSATGRDAANVGPYKSQFQQIARSRRRPMIRTKSESDFQMLMDEDVHEMRKKLLHTHHSRHHHASTFNLKKVTKFTRQQKLVLVSIALVDFTSFCAMSILAPFFPSEASKKGMEPWVSGFVFSVYALCVFIASPFMGKAVSLVGPKFLLIVGVFLGGSCNILFGLLDRVESLWMFTMYCFLVRIFEALGAAAFATSCYTFVAKVFPDNIGTVLGVLETFVGLGMSVGPAIGGFLYDWKGYGLPFFALGTFMLLTIPINLYLLPSNDDSDTENESGNESTWKLVKLPPIFVLSLVVIVASNTWSFLDPTLEPHLREFNLSASQLGLLFLIASVTYALSSPLFGLLGDRMDRTWILMVVGLLLSSFGLLLLGPSPIIGLENSIWLNVVALLIIGAAISMTLLPTFEAMLDIAINRGYGDEMSTYGMIGGLWSSVYSLGEVTGPSFGGFLFNHFGFPICATVMSAICFGLAIFVFFYFQTCYSDIESTLDSSTGSSRQSLAAKMKSSDIYDSGISEKSVSSSCQSVEVDFQGTNTTHSNGNNNNNNNHDEFGVQNENTPLLRNNNKSNIPIPKRYSSADNVNRNPDEIFAQLSWSSDSSDSSTSSTGSSYPDALRTIGITAHGAIEI